MNAKRVISAKIKRFPKNKHLISQLGATFSRRKGKPKQIRKFLFQYHKLVYLYKIESYGTKYIDSNWRIL